MTLATPWSAILNNKYLVQVLGDQTQTVRSLLEAHGWDPGLADSLTPLFLARALCPYANLHLCHPGSVLPYDEEDMPGRYLLQHGLLLIGSAPNGDFVAIKASEDPGVVVYVSHEEFDYEDLSNLPQITRKVSPSVSAYLEALHQGLAPLDYWDAEPTDTE